ncbi:6-carboxyhexanoate--CoA ligase [Staphylococcus sp. SQ8-PEA]|uniref:6-carboxyhexanoate--CoA ligase n=1 Tax=Staphylococcus marylandisciuri TaxID=2981529 RepID=A0ABT2QQN9_9STAP|nr:6-carboxyhexanoate--CoA ligase [Staphylococcus marylandisciuri]MCU5746304.1 6-carboxyhexanoate--CoA ligase [Staphylococcus marylandisciuri]
MYSVKMRSSQQGEHLSGAETICEAHQIDQTISKFFHKGFTHQNGDSDALNIKVQKITQPLRHLNALSILEEESADLSALSQSHGITDQALQRGLEYIHDKTRYTGALILSKETGERLDRTGVRGIRATHFCFKSLQERRLLNDRVQDALAIATIITSYPGVIGELCVSDDLHYTTGYFASKDTGYHRLYHVKEDHSRAGGRIIFVNDDIAINDFIEFLEIIPKQVNY